jgi:glycosyltransferase involved in cell wall biosynthesis
MRIALLSPTYPPDVGGLATSAERLARMLTAAGQHVHVVVPTGSLAPGQGAHSSDGNLTISRFGAQRRTADTLAEWFRLIVAAHAEQPFDLLHAYFVTVAGFVATYAGRYLGLPSVVSARGNDLDRAVFDPAKAAHTLHALQHASAITANSRELVRQAEALAPGRTATLIPNGVDTTLFTPLSATENTENTENILNQHASSEASVSSVAKNAARIGFVGEARAKKGLAPLLLAFREVAQTRPAALMLIGGVRAGDDESLVTIFQKQNPDLPLIVTPYMPHDALPAYYRALDVLALPSLQDGLPNALLEGMACGCAVVASTAGGIPDVLRHGENGLLVPPRDSTALAFAITTLLDDPAERARLGENARATVLRDYAPEQELERNLAVYRQIM